MPFLHRIFWNFIADDFVPRRKPERVACQILRLQGAELGGMLEFQGTKMLANKSGTIQHHLGRCGRRKGGCQSNGKVRHRDRDSGLLKMDHSLILGIEGIMTT